MSNLEETKEGTVAQEGAVQKIDVKKVGIIAAIVLAVLLVVYIGFVFYFKNHFFFRSTLNGVNSSGSTVDAVMKRIEKKANNYSISFVEKDGIEKFKPADFDMEVASSKAEFEKALSKQNEFAWVGALFAPRNYKSKIVVDFNEEKFDGILSNLKDVVDDNATQTEDARVAFSEGDKFVIKKEVYGTEVDKESLSKVSKTAVMTLDSKVDLKKDKCYVQPKLTSDDDELKQTCEKLNDKIDLDYTYTVGGQNEKVSKETLASFFKNDEKGDITYNDEAIAAFVKEMAAKYDTAGKPKTLVTYTGATVTVPGGSYGWKIDKEKEAAKIKADLDAGKDVKRDFEYARTAASRGANDYGNSYIEVNRTGQYFVVHKDGAVVLQSKVVTGNINKGDETHVGAYFVAYKAKNATLKGPTWNSKVGFWMPFNGGEGLHDAVWQPSFGGTYYKIRGSHGCVNLPLNVASQLYNIVSAGYPVLVYDLPGTEDNEPNVKDAQAFSDELNTIGEVTPASQGTIEALRKKYFRLTPEAISMVPNMQILNDAEANLKAQLAATGVDWNPPTTSKDED